MPLHRIETYQYFLILAWDKFIGCVLLMKMLAQQLQATTQVDILTTKNFASQLAQTKTTAPTNVSLT